MTPFVVVTMARSGSHRLQYLLNAHPRVKMRGELLNQTFETCSDAELIAAAFRARPGMKAVGFKMLHLQLMGRPFTLPSLLAVPGLKVIVLQRLDQIGRLRSEAQATTTDYWAVTALRRLPTPVRLDPWWTLQWLRVADAFHKQLAEHVPPERRAWITYEQLMANQDATLRQVWAALGVTSPGPLAPVTYRQEHRPLADTVTNLDELRAVLSGTRYRDLL